MRRSRLRSRTLPGVLATAMAASASSACVNTPAVLTQLSEARRLASELHVEFTKASEAANRAVMADTDEASTAAAERGETRAGRSSSETSRRCAPFFSHSATATTCAYLDAFKSRYEEYRRLDDEILPLAVENTNVKAQRLSFGPARRRPTLFERHSTRLFARAAAKDICCAEALAGTGP